MAVIDETLKTLINAKTSKKVIATISKSGVPHVVYKGSIHVTDEGQLQLYEFFENAKSNQNLVYSIWFQKKVAINILTEDNRSFEIIGLPVKSITAGKNFEKVYQKVQQDKGDIDLSAIWLIEPESVEEETFTVKKKAADDITLTKHLDRFVSYL